MRLIDADVLMAYLTIIPIDLGYREVDEIKAYIKRMPTIEPEITEQDVIEYCRAQCLIVITEDLFSEMMARWEGERHENHTQTRNRNHRLTADADKVP